MDQIKEQIQLQMKRAMHDLVKEIAHKPSPSNADVDWFGRLVGELCERLIGLTPSRRDLHDSLLRQVDIGLMQQMFRHNAFDKQDVTTVSEVFIIRMAMLCAPCQDADVIRARSNIRECETGADAFVEMITSLNSILDETVRLNEEFRATTDTPPSS